MRKVVTAIAVNDMRLLLRDKGGAFVTFVFPLAYCIFFGLIFATQSMSSRSIDMVLVDEDQSQQSASFVQLLKKSGAIELTMASREQAIDQVRRAKTAAYVIITKGFGQALPRVLGEDRPKIVIGIDPARAAESEMVKGLITKFAFELFYTPIILRISGDLPNDQHPTKTNFSPIEIETTEIVQTRTGPASSYDISFPQGIIWGVLGCCASFGISLVNERTTGTLSRLLVAPISRTHILAGKALACFTSTLVLGMVLFFVGWLAFSVIPQSPIHLAISLLAISIAFVGIMMFISILGKTERAVSGMGWAVLLAMAMIGGGMVPRFFMPHWMQSLSAISPVSWAIKAMEGAVWRGFSTSEMLLPWSVLVGIGLLFFAIGIRGFSWPDKG